MLKTTVTHLFNNKMAKRIKLVGILLQTKPNCSGKEKKGFAGDVSTWAGGGCKFQRTKNAHALGVPQENSYSPHIEVRNLLTSMKHVVLGIEKKTHCTHVMLVAPIFALNSSMSFLVFLKLSSCCKRNA